MAKHIKVKELRSLPKYEPPLDVRIGIDNTLVPNATMMMAHPVIPPGGRNQRHYHKNTAAAMHVLKGRMRVFLGPKNDLKETDVQAGDFIFVPRGEIHGIMNLSKTEPVELIATYNHAGSVEEAGTVFVEDVWK